MTDSPRWKDIALFLEALKAHTKYNEKRIIISKLYDTLRKRANPTETLMVLRFLLPQYDTTRSAYGFKEALLGKNIYKALGMDKNHPDAKRIDNYRLPINPIETRGDFVATACAVFSARYCPSRQASMLLSDLDVAIDSLKEDRDAFFNKAVMSMTPVEFKWLLYYLLKDQKIGASEHFLLKLWHPDAQKIFDTTNSLTRVATLFDPATRAEAGDIQVFTPFRPMLAERPASLGHVSTIVKQFDGQFYAQEKIDGERIQIHYSNGTFKFFSRNCIEHASLVTSLGRHLCIDPQITSFIMDGEIVVIDRTTGKHLPMVTMRPSAITDHFRYYARVYVFDLLQLNDMVITKYQLRRRLEALTKYFGSTVCNHFHVLPTKDCASLDDICAFLDTIYAERGEGIVIKDPASVYLIGERHAIWTKIKVDYDPSLLETIDLVVIGAWYGQAKRTGLFSEFLLGAIATDGTTHSFCRVGTGLSMDQMTRINQQLEECQMSTCPTDTFIAGPRPHAYFDPTSSVVFEVQGAELVKSTDYFIGLTLRFPRIRRIRHDKSFMDIATVTDIRKLMEYTGGRLSKPITAFNFKRVNLKRSAPASSPASPEPRAKRNVSTVEPTDFKDIDFYLDGRFDKITEICRKIISKGGRICHGDPSGPHMVVTQHPESYGSLMPRYCFMNGTVC